MKGDAVLRGGFSVLASRRDPAFTHVAVLSCERLSVSPASSTEPPSAATAGFHAAKQSPELVVLLPTMTPALSAAAAGSAVPPPSEGSSCGCNVVAEADDGHENLPVGGHRKSPLAAIGSPRGWPSDLPTDLS